jgi:hypothetical protein
MQKLPLSDDLKGLLKILVTESQLAKDHNNAKNRAITAIRNQFKQQIQTKAWSLDTKVAYSGVLVEYKAADRTEIPPEDFYKMLKDGEITEEQFLKCISVRKSDVSTHVGSDILLTLEQPVEGDRDIRLTELPPDEAKNEYVLVPASTGAVKRKSRGPLKKVTSVTQIKPRHRIVTVKRER